MTKKQALPVITEIPDRGDLKKGSIPFCLIPLKLK
jgi:hypothetical protein